MNAAERAIRTWKDHFISGMAINDKDFPIRLWDKLINQATMTLNMLQTSRRNPLISAYSKIYGEFDLNKTPMEPPGTKIIIHKNPQQRKLWANHGVYGWYLVPAMQNYRCWRTYVIHTREERITDTVEFLPQHIQIPRQSPNKRATVEAQKLVHGIKHPQPQETFTPIGYKQLQAWTKLAKTFQSQIGLHPGSSKGE